MTMFISIQELERERVEFDKHFAPGAIDFGADLRQAEVLDAEGHADLVRENRGGKNVVEDIRVVGGYSTTMTVACSRCLEPVREPVAGRFDLLYRPQGADARMEEVAITAAETEIGYYAGDGILLEDVLREQILLALPSRSICQEACRGLCAQCGANLNADPAHAHDDAHDPRWAALADIRNRMKQ